MVGFGRLTGLGVLALAAASAAGAQDNDVYTSAIDCGVLHAFYSGAKQGEAPDEAKQHIEIATRYFTLAFDRDPGSGEQTSTAIETKTAALIAKFEELVSDATTTRAYFNQRSESCNAFKMTVIEEFEAADVNQ